MATEMRIWRVIDNKTLELLQDANLEDNRAEKDLESWIENDPTILGEDLLVVARQPNIQGVGIPDLICIDAGGVPVVVELKRKSTPREAIAQALDYASWLDSLRSEEFVELADQYLGKCLGKSLGQAFSENFLVDLPEVDCQNHRIILAAPRLDAAAERIINYLSERYEVAINAVFFKYARLGSEEILVRSVLVSEDAKAHAGSTKPKGPRPGNLPEIAEVRKVTALVDICRQVRTAANWDEEAATTYGGSWIYSLHPETGWRSLFGINVSGELMMTPVGELDVWVRAKNVAEVTGIDETAIRDVLAKDYYQIAVKSRNCIIRLRTTAEAEKLVHQLAEWASGTNSTGAAV